MTDAALSDIDRMAYVDGQLDDLRRLEVEDTLSRQPTAAAQLMGDLARRTALRIALRPSAIAPSAALEARLRRPGTSAGWPGRRAVAAVLIGTVMAGLGSAGLATWLTRATPEAIVDDAIQAREASLLRTRMTSQAETPRLAIAEIRSAVRVRVPTLPTGWTLLDVQVFPSDAGPAVQLMIDTGPAGQVFLFTSPDIAGQDDRSPVLVRRDGETVAVWDVGDQSYALIGTAPRGVLNAMALDLSDNRLL